MSRPLRSTISCVSSGFSYYTKRRQAPIMYQRKSMILLTDPVVGPEGSNILTRRGATVERPSCLPVALRRPMVCFAAVRGLKPTATVVVSLRETGTRCPIFRARSSSCARWRCIPAAQSWSSALRWETCRPCPRIFTRFGVARLLGDLRRLLWRKAF